MDYKEKLINMIENELDGQSQIFLEFILTFIQNCKLNKNHCAKYDDKK